MKHAIRIIGIDPGLRNTGWGVIDSLGNSLRFVASGTVKSDNKLDLASRLNQLYEGLERVLHDLQPFEAAVVDGQVGKTYPSLWAAPVFSPDGKRTAYVARHGEQNNAVAVIDGEEGLTAINYFGVSTPVFSPDSKRVAYSVQTGEGEQTVIVDGAEKAKVKTARELVFSPDSKRLAWFEKRDKETFAVVDGESGLGSRDMYTDEPVFFSPDSRHFFYFARKGDKVVMLMDHREIREADQIAPLPGFEVPGKVRYMYLVGAELFMGEADLP